MTCVIGIDFDNTIVSYNDVMFETAMRKGWIDKGVKKNKKDIRNKIRQLPNGETKWQHLQSFVYGKGMERARLIEGVQEFFQKCRRRQIKICIVSHKTEWANKDRRVNLRKRALRWMRENGFFHRDGLGLTESQVFFESTRQGKVDRIKDLGCTHFIDDLEETFLEESFPKDIKKFLYLPSPDGSTVEGVKIFNTWWDVYEYFFDTRR